MIKANKIKWTNPKEFLINYTKRETLLYKITDAFLFEILNFFNYLRQGHVIRERRIKKYLKKHKIKKLHIGCGSCLYNGFLNSDAVSGQIHLDIRKKLPFNSGIFDEIYSNHLIEHVYKKDFIFFLKECRRVLKPHGKIIFGTPDLKKIIETFYILEDKEKMKVIASGHEIFSFDDEFHVAGYINDLSHIFFGHKFLYDYDYLEYLLKKKGFININHKDNLHTSDNYINEKLKDRINSFWDATTLTIEAEK